MAPKFHSNDDSNTAPKNKRKFEEVQQRRLPPAASRAVANDDTESSSSSLVPYPGIILALEQNSNGNDEPQYPPLEIEEEEGYVAQSQILPTEHAMMPWDFHPSAADMKSPSNAAVDQEQRHILQALSEETLSYIETTSDGRSSASNDSSFATLLTIERQWWRDDRSRMFVDFPDIDKVSADKPHICYHGKCWKKPSAWTCPSALWKHLPTHIPKGMRPFVCLECPGEPIRKDFLLPKDLLRHFIEKHDVDVGEQKPHLESAKCGICGRSFSRIGGLTRHQKIFKGTCMDAKRPRRKSAPPANISSGGPPLAPVFDRPTPGVDGPYYLSPSTPSGSVVSGTSRPSMGISDRRQTMSTTTSFSVHFSPDIEQTPEAAEALADTSDLVPWSGNRSFFG